MADPILYILMRTDLASMNPGKGMAQAAHAANAFVYAASRITDSLVLDGYQNWYRATPQGFGTTVVLAVNDAEHMRNTVATAKALRFPADIVHDPSYPVKDGNAYHLIPLDTCAYVFSPDRDRMPCLPTEELELHP